VIAAPDLAPALDAWGTGLGDAALTRTAIHDALTSTGSADAADDTGLVRSRHGAVDAAASTAALESPLEAISVATDVALAAVGVVVAPAAGCRGLVDRAVAVVVHPIAARRVADGPFGGTRFDVEIGVVAVVPAAGLWRETVLVEVEQRPGADAGDASVAQRAVISIAAGADGREVRADRRGAGVGGAGVAVVAVDAGGADDGQATSARTIVS